MTASAFSVAYKAEQAALNARFSSTSANAQQRAQEAHQAAREAGQKAKEEGYRHTDSRTFTPIISRLLQAAQDAQGAANYLDQHP